ncbi:hypothetical protein BS17DRAFT_799244 [Gyrodon lividus]|nr:hypothetical protein BS17DRAFT_799244 [Gyrodon lividus]
MLKYYKENIEEVYPKVPQVWEQDKNDVYAGHTRSLETRLAQVLSVELVQEFIRFARTHDSSITKDDIVSPTITSSSLGFKRDAASSATSYSPDSHTPALIYRTGKGKWSPPKGPAAYCHLKELCEKAIENEEEDEDKEKGEAKKPVTGPVTIWIGDVLALLKDYQIADVDVDFREFAYVREVGPRLHGPVGDLGPLVEAVGTMALYLTEGGDSNKLLGLTCRHILILPNNTNVVDYVYHPSASPRYVLLLGKRAFTNLVDSIKVRIGRHGIAIERWRSQVAGFERMEQGTDGTDVAKAWADRVVTQGLMDQAETATDALAELLKQRRFTEDYGVFLVNHDKLGDGFQGNKIDLGAKLDPGEFMLKCFPRDDAGWKFRFPDDRLLPLMGIISDDWMRHPDMWDLDGELCLLVFKNDNATGTTIGHANGVFSIVRDYFNDVTVNQTSMEWGIMNYDVIADIHGRIGGMLTGGSGRTESSDMTHATPFWWLLERIQANGFPNAHLNVVVA